MGMGWHEWPLMVFTVLGQCVVGGFIVLGLALLFGGLSRGSNSGFTAVCLSCGC